MQEENDLDLHTVEDQNDSQVKVLSTKEEIVQNGIDDILLVEEEMRKHGNLTYLPNYKLHDGPYSQKNAQAAIVRRHDDNSYKGIYATIQFWKRKRKKDEFELDKSIRFDLEETQNLFNYLRDAIGTAEADEGTYIPLPAAEVIANLNTVERQKFSNLLSDLVHSRKVAELYLDGQLSIDVLEHLSAAAQQVRYKAAIEELKEMVITGKDKNGTKNLNEHDYQKWFEAHTWVFGTEYVRRIDIRSIDPHATVDFILETTDGFFDVLELKTPNAKILDYDKSHKTFFFHLDVSKVIAQATKYLNAIERNADRIYRDSESHILLVRPRVRIVMGRSSNWDEQRREAFRRLGSVLHSIELMTFDHVIQRTQMLIDHYESRTELETVQLDGSESSDF